MEHQTVTLDNGLRVVTVPMPGMGSVTISLAIGAGSRHESHLNAGVAHLLEHMVFKGTERRPSSTAISDEIESVGGLINASTDKELTVFWAKIPHDHADLALDLLADMVRHSRLRPSDIGREKGVVLEELSMLWDDPQETVHVLSDDVMWPHQPVGREVAGTPASVARLSGKDLRAFRQQYYGPNNAVLSLAGGIDPEAAGPLVDRFFGEWGPVVAPTPPRAFIPDTETRSRVDVRATQQAYLCLTFPGIRREHPDRWALDVLLSILGGGTSSRLFVQLRERLGLVYDVHAYASYLADTGSITIYAGMDPARLERAVDAIMSQILRLRARRVPESELARARSAMRGRLWLGLEDTYAVASWFGLQDLLRERIVTPMEAATAIDSVTADHVLAVARSLLGPDEVRVAAVGPIPDFSGVKPTGGMKPYPVGT